MTTYFITRATTKLRHKLCKIQNICVAFSDTISQKYIQATLDECPVSLVSNLSL